MVVKQLAVTQERTFSAEILRQKREVEESVNNLRTMDNNFNFDII